MEHYQRKTFLINKNFQIRYCIYVCSWLFALSCVYPWILKEVFDFFFRFVGFHAPKVTTIDVKATQHQLLVLLISLQAVFLGVTFLISVFVSHRIAGPIYKLRQWLQAGREGRLRSDLYFRKSDYFREVASDYNLMVSGVLARVDRNVARLEKMGSNKEMQEVIADLRQIREQTAASESSEAPAASARA
jgi:methyl-accepting chemotaxis protein